VTVECRAKINTFLAVGPPDDRGWHPLRSIFQEIDLADTLTILPADIDEVTFSVEGIPSENTITRALRLLREQVEVPPLRIHVEKRIPAESGLGGGSSDAAGVLRTFGKGLTPEALGEIALRVGADVPFFLMGGRARAEGYGERLARLPDLPKRWLVLARPSAGCPTGEMFRQLDAKPREFRDFPSGDELYNDFERVAPCASLDLIERLRVYGADDAALTGSGSVVFGRFPNRASAEGALAKIASEAPWTCLSST
jgi:4-diphosphocytidyl-2-C-methyl-D-erythritol kinase